MKEMSLPKAANLVLVGIGHRPLNERARGIVMDAEVLFASTRLRDVFKNYVEYEAVKDRVRVIDKVPETIEAIRESLSRIPGRPVVLLASGDPLFFGIGRRLIEEFSQDRVEVLPDLSSMQAAFARINVPWDDAFCISVHGGPDSAKRRKLPYELDDIPRLLERYRKLAVLTDRQNNPVEIARGFTSVTREKGPAIVMHVCERMGYPDERVWTGTVEAAAAMNFADPNVVVLGIQETGDRRPATGVVFGLREDEISHARGLITKDEVRAVTIHKLRLPARGVLWDIGAGSGSISIEAARTFPGLKVFSIEQNSEQIGHLKANRTAFDVRNLEIVPGAAPAAFSGLPGPDRAFIGGSGGQLAAILTHLRERMRSGIIVVNAIKPETLTQAVAGLEQAEFAVSIAEVVVSRSRTVSGKRQMTAQNPISIVTGEKPGHDG